MVIGGTSLAGGRGSVIGTLFGVILIGLISNGLNLLNHLEVMKALGELSATQDVIKGLVIVFAVLLDIVSRAGEGRKRANIGGNGMSMRTRRIAPSGLALLAGLGLAATAHAEDKKWHVGAAVYGLQTNTRSAGRPTSSKHPAVVSGLVDLTVFDGKYDHLTQRSQFDTMETQKYDGAIYVTIDSKACDAVVKKAVTEIFLSSARTALAIRPRSFPISARTTCRPVAMWRPPLSAA